MTGSAGLDRRRAGRLRERLAPSVEARDVPALAALVARGGDVQVEVLGSLALGDARPLPRRAIFRIASLTEPITAAGAMILIDDGVVALNDPVQRFIPELADRRVLRGLEAGLDDTTPAERSITVEDLLTFRLGFGAIMALPGTYPIQDAESELGLRTLGPPWTHRHRLALTSGLRVFATLPLLHQPGADWRYNTGAQVLGILLERASGQPLELFLRERLFEPLGMTDTSFSVPVEKVDRFTTAYMPEAESGTLGLLDPPTGGWWNEPPAMANGAGMLVSTLDDFWAFVSMLVAGGSHEGAQLLSPQSVAAMTGGPPDGGPTRIRIPLPGGPGRRMGLRHGCARTAGRRAARTLGLRLERWHGNGLDQRPGARPHRDPADHAGDDVAGTPSTLHDLLANGLRRHGGVSRAGGLSTAQLR